MSIMMEKYLRAAGISTPMGRVLDEANQVLCEDAFQDLSQWIQDNGTSKPSNWNDIPRIVLADTPKDVQDAIRNLPVITVGHTPMDRFDASTLKRTRGIGVARGAKFAYVIDTSGYDYVRYAVAVPRNWVK